MRNKINKITLSFSLGLVLLLALLIKYSGEFMPFEEYLGLAISFDESQNIPVERYIVQDTEKPEEFLIAPTIPTELNLQLISPSNATLRATVVPLYLPQDCSLDQTGLSTLRFKNQGADSIEVPLNNIRDVNLSVNKNQGFGISLEDGRNGRCGRATVTFFEQKSSAQLITIFILVWGTLTLLAIFARSNSLIITLGVCINFLLVFANRTIQPPFLMSFLSTIVFSVGITGLLLFITALPIWRWLKASLITVIAGSVIFLALAFIYYPVLFGGPLSEDSIHAVLQSNARQGYEFWLAFIGAKRTLILLLLGLVLFLLSYLMQKTKAINRLSSAAISLLLLSVSIFFTSTIGYMPSIALAKESVELYFDELETFKALRDERTSKLEQVDASSNKTNQSLIVVLGESASKHHISSYGYGRNTAPNADKLINDGDMIRFDAAYSNHVHSNPTISKALTAASSYTNNEWIHSPSILSLANAAGVETAWVSNKPMFGVWDNHMNVIGNEASDVSFINKRVGTEKYSNEHDAAMLPLVYENITSEANNQLIFMHLQGSHVHYCSRVPEGFDYFQDSPSKAVYGDFIDPAGNSAFITHFINCYDNSIRYTDHVLNELISSFDDTNKPSAVLYISDHGENVMDNKAHNASNFDYFMFEVPAYFWANEEWQSVNNDLWQNLQNNRDKVFTNDHLFELVVGLVGATSSEVDLRNDISSEKYIEPEKPRTMHGEVRLDADDNWTFWQRQNLRNLKANDLLDKVVAHRVNTTSKAGTMLKQGLNTLEIDLHVKSNGDETSLVVGHDAQSSTDIDLESFLSTLASPEVKQLWLDMRDLDSATTQIALNSFTRIEQQLALLKNSVIVVNTIINNFKDISQAGYTLAYAPNDNELTTLSDSTGSTQDWQQAISNINQSAQSIGASIISLPASEYQAISRNLDTLLNGDMSLHLYLPNDIELATPNLETELINKDYFNDERVSAISLKVNARRDL